MSADLWSGALIDATIWHGRTGDVARQFRYRATYAALPLAAFENGDLPLQPDRRGLWQLRRRDHGSRDGSSLTDFIRAQLAPLGLNGCNVTLVTMPRGLWHGFNPISFWLARDGLGLRAVLAEVSNTFGERHFYLCHHPDNAVIDRGDRLAGDKLFHVSPFLPREGRYRFRFDVGPGRFGAWIDWIGADDRVKLRTSMTGRIRGLSRGSLRLAALSHPFQPLRITALIHWQAAKLLIRGVRYRRRPTQFDQDRSEVYLTEKGDV